MGKCLTRPRTDSSGDDGFGAAVTRPPSARASQLVVPARRRGGIGTRVPGRSDTMAGARLRNAPTHTDTDRESDILRAIALVVAPFPESSRDAHARGRPAA